jgi:fumarate hydratase subunit alpha
MREVQAKDVTKVVARLCQEANFFLPQEVLSALRKAREKEESSWGKEILYQILENADIAAKEHIPLCQDCGIAVVYLYIGQEVYISGGELYRAVEDGVRQGYIEGYLRPSMVHHPFSSRVNTGDNTPPIVHYEIVPGDELKIVVMPKGEGAENGSRLAMLEPSRGREGVIDFVVKTIEEIGSSICPPLIIGVGIGGTAERVMDLAKKALLRPLNKPNPDSEVAELEEEILEKVNSLGIGPQGLGGKITALAVHAETSPCHIAALPVAVNPQCHCARYKVAVL